MEPFAIWALYAFVFNSMFWSVMIYSCAIELEKYKSNAILLASAKNSYTQSLCGFFINLIPVILLPLYGGDIALAVYCAIAAILNSIFFGVVLYEAFRTNLHKTNVIGMVLFSLVINLLVLLSMILL